MSGQVRSDGVLRLLSDNENEGVRCFEVRLASKVRSCRHLTLSDVTASHDAEGSSSTLSTLTSPGRSAQS